ncbi:hypothetical protein K450DRAFT_226466 [Umbelopsis ramanniana AG]|uniref:Uncharacterized protein n=1 Tax=Umbelopsis ramanniana AG TaxID=1314678 RepID=A0AAD5EFE7_UMBRA|nr:uncharacterized protein K450DRAFT_226466 [Umbelopsis ramanniana AG]KAI8582698.1 hypothetical protein K450DRAFT_226466 [Umbelopsis ramanniana AG]
MKTISLPAWKDAFVYSVWILSSILFHSINSNDTVSSLHFSTVIISRFIFFLFENYFYITNW